jgi:hypothetical protein
MRSPSTGSTRTVELVTPSFGDGPPPASLLALYRAFALLAALLGAAALVAAALQAWWLGLLALVVVPAAVWAAITLVRVTCEVMGAVLRMADHVGEIRDELPHLRGTIDQLAEDMPRLRFLRRGASNREQPVVEEERSSGAC